MGLSAVVIACDEEKNIGPCLSSLAFADEIVVVDSGSSDRTIERARAFTDKVYRRDFDNFSAQKNFAVGKTSFDWVLSVDADERVTPALAGEIRETVSDSPAFAAYAVKRRTALFGKTFGFSGLQDDKPVRLFKKEAARFERPVHEVLKVDGPTGLLKNTLEHASFQSFRDYMRRLQLYTTLDGERNGSPERRFRFFLRPFYRFLSLYVGKQGFRDGREGFFYGVLSAYYEFIRLAKRWEARRSAENR
ncbi:MAG: glycosyltransferase family 2 protein [Candidatus Omnitrophota bacterium]